MIVRRKILRKPAVLILELALLCCTQPAVADEASSSYEQQAKQILKATGVSGGLVVHLGCGDGKLTAAFKVNDRYRVHGLDRSAANVETARQYIQSLGVYGDVSVDRWSDRGLPYTDNLVNLVVSAEAQPDLMDEVMRVLAPQGVAYIKQNGVWSKTVKPRSESIDEWTHYLHDATGNAVAHDEVVGPPRHMQWIGEPLWSRHHDRMASMSALVSAGGRIFYIIDEGSRVSIELPPKWTLVARDAFNGTTLWKQSIPKWHNHLWPLKSGPTQLARRLVAQGNRVYATLGLEAPLTALDAATGEIVRTYDGTKNTEEVIASQEMLFLLVNDGPSEMSTYTPKLNVGDQGRVAQQWRWNEKPRHVMAVEADTGRILWSKESVVAPLTLAADGERVFFHNGESLVCLDRTTGARVWESSPVARRASIPLNFGPKLVVYKQVVLFAGGDRRMEAFAVEDGRELWSAPHSQSAYASPEDLLVTGGLVWSAPTTKTGDTGIFTGRDPLTGDVKTEFPPDVATYWFHHRCYIAKATDRFILPSRTGIEFVDYQNQHWDINHWVRGGCLYGIMPCNGMIYTPPHDCACYPETKLFGFNALAPNSPSLEIPADAPDEDRLERGPAFDHPVNEASASSSDADWPTYRHDAKRSGYTRHAVLDKLKQRWQAPLGGTLSSLVVAGGRVYVADINAHTVLAVSEDSGKTLWSYTTGGRVDSPPTVYQGRVLFGSADGFVYCVRASDGALVWRFRAAPLDRRLMAFEQLESVWPVHGSVLVRDGIVYFVAGRSNFLDGGLRWYRLDVKTGRKLSEVVIDEHDPQTGETLQARVQDLNMPVGLPDVLSSDGTSIFMRSQRFDLEGNRQDLGPHSGDPVEQGSVQSRKTAHLFSPTGFLDGTWFHRSYWVFGSSFAGGHAGYYQAGKFTPGGRILVFDDASVYGFGRKPQYYDWTTTMEYHFFKAGKDPKIIEAPQAPARANRRGNEKQAEWHRQRHPEYDWSESVPLFVRAMVKTDQSLFIAGPPDVLDEEQAFARIVKGDADINANLAEQDDSLNGRLGALLQVISATDGTKLAEYKLSSLPVWDGMVAANGRLFLSTVDGNVLCFDGRSGQR